MPRPVKKNLNKKKSVKAKRTALSRKKFEEDPKPQQEEKKIVVITRSVGSPGTEIYSGHFFEEYLRDLQGYQRADKFDQMRRSDAAIKMCVNSIKNPIRSAVYEWDAGKEGNTEHAEFLSHVFFNMPGKKWSQLLTEASTIIEFGHSVFEKIHCLNLSHRAWGNYIGLDDLSWRSPRTIERWELNEFGRLSAVVQLAHGDLRRSLVRMPAETLVLMNLDQEGANYEGISLLRPCFGPWKRKESDLKLKAIGNEKFAIPTPDVEVPAGKENGDEFENMVSALENYISHETGYLIHPQGWNVKLNPSPFDPEKLIKSIDFEDKQIAFAFLANFLMLAQSGGGGGYALSNDLSDFFLGGINYVIRNICEPLEEVGKELIILKYGPQETYPKLRASGYADKIGQEFGSLIKSLFEAKALTPDDDLEQNIRKRIGLPEMSEKGRRDFNTGAGLPGGPDPNYSGNSPSVDDLSTTDGEDDDSSENDDGHEGDEIADDSEKLSSVGKRHLYARKGVVREIKAGSDELLEIIQRNLAEQAENIIDQLKGERNPTATKNVKRRNQKRYETELILAMTRVSNSAIEAAKQEVGTKKDIRLAEQETTFKFVKRKLPKKLSDRIKSQATNIAESTISHLEGTVFMAFGDSIVSTKDDDIVESDLHQAAEKVIEGGGVHAASVNAASRIVNESRVELFTDEQIIQDIESFTFYNPDPSSEICQDLNGKTFRADDPEAKRYYPPLHHNCKSTLYPNMKNKKNNPEISPEGLKPSDPSLDKYVSLDDHACIKKILDG